MRYNYKYRISPSPAVEQKLEWHIDICRQLYNHLRRKVNRADDVPSRFRMQSSLPDMKEWWEDLSEVYSKVLQMVVKRVFDNLNRLKKRRDRGYRIGQLKWKAPREYRSLTYNQVGFDLKNTRDQPVLVLSKIGELPIRLHRSLPGTANVKQVSIKKELTGEWFAIFGIEMERAPPTKPNSPQRVVGIDMGIRSYACDTEGIAVESLDLSDEHARLAIEQRKLARKQPGSNNWEKQRLRVVECHQHIKRKRRDFLHKLADYYAREYELVAVENLDVKGLIELPGNSRDRSSAAWGTFFRMLEYKCEREGTYFVSVRPEGTTKECAACGAVADKPLSSRTHSCRECGFEVDRDLNAALNVLSRGLDTVGVGHSESTPAETALPAEPTVVSAKYVLETGSPSLFDSRYSSKAG